MSIGHPIGTRLVAYYHGIRYLAVVAAGEQEDDEPVVVVTEPGKERRSMKNKPFASLSGAGRALTGAKAVGGRKFWTAYDGEEPPAPPERKRPAPSQRPVVAQKAAPQATTGKKAAAATKPAEKPVAEKETKEPKIRITREPPAELRIVKPAKNQDGLEPNQVRYLCDACVDVFVATNEKPSECAKCGRPAVVPYGSDIPPAKTAVA